MSCHMWRGIVAQWVLHRALVKSMEACFRLFVSHFSLKEKMAKPLGVFLHHIYSNICINIRAIPFSDDEMMAVVVVNCNEVEYLIIKPNLSPQCHSTFYYCPIFKIARNHEEEQSLNWQNHFFFAIL